MSRNGCHAILAAAAAAIECGAAKRRTKGRPRRPTTVKLRIVSLDRRKNLSIAPRRARRVMRRKQADLWSRMATELGAPSRVKGAPRPTQAPVLERLDRDGHTERIEHLQERTDTVHVDFKELFTDPLHWETPDWIWQRCPWEVLQSLARIDSQQVGGDLGFPPTRILHGRPFGD